MSITVYRGSAETEVEITENTKLVQEIMGEDYVHFSENTRETLDIEIGDYITVDGRNYYVNTEPDVTKNNEKDYDYTIDFQAVHYNLDKVQFFNLDAESDFFMNSTLEDFITWIAANMNRVFAGWSKGTVTASHKDEFRNLHFQGETCYQVLRRLATEYDAEFSFTGKAINMVDTIGSATGETFTYKSGLRGIKKQSGNNGLITRLFAYGSSKNLPSDYRSGLDRLEFSNGGNKFIEKNITTYGTIEAVKIYDEIYPHRTGSISSVATVNVVIDSNMPFNLNSYLLPGIKPKFCVQTGDLAGIEFEIESYDNGGRTFTILKYTDEHLKTVPNNTLQFVRGDEYVLTDCEMPTTYVTAAESLLKVKAQSFLDDRSIPDVAYKINLDPHYLDDNSISLSLGDEITVVDNDLNVSVTTRISKIEYPLIDDTELEVEVSNQVHVGAISRLNDDIGDQKRKAQISKTGDVSEFRWGWWMKRGPNTGRTYATDSGMPGHFERIVIDGVDNAMKFFDSSNVEKVSIEANAYNGTPGIILHDGILANYVDSNNNFYGKGGFLTIVGDATQRLVGGIPFVIRGHLDATATTLGTVMGVEGVAEVSSTTDDSIGVRGKITGDGGSGTAYAIYGLVDGSFTNNAYSGFFNGGHFGVELGGGTKSFFITNNSGNTLFEIDSHGNISPDLNLSGDLAIGGDLSLSGTFAYEPLKNLNFCNDCLFPCGMPLIRNEEQDNTLSQASGTEIVVNTLDTVAGTITLSWLPYIESIWSPGSDEKWALMDLDTHASADPALSGDYADLMLIDSGTYSTRTLSYTVKRGAIGNWSVSDKVALYNPYRQNMTFDSNNPVIEESAGAAWRAECVTPAGNFIHSDGSLIMLVNGMAVGGTQSIGAFKSDGNDWSSFTVLNGDASIFSAGGASWRQNKIAGKGSVFKLPNEDRYILYCDGKDAANKNCLGWVKFDEDFSAGSIEYASAEIISTGASTSGYTNGCVTFHDGRYRLIYSDLVTGTITDYCVREAFSTTPEGPFSGTDMVFDCSALENSCYASSHASPKSVFFWKGRLCLFAAGTSQYSYSGNKANKVLGLWYWDDTRDTPAWVQDTRNPVLINPFYCDEVWGKDDWMEDHLGNTGTPIMHPANGYLYFPFAATSGTDNYKIGFLIMDVFNMG